MDQIIDNRLEPNFQFNFQFDFGMGEKAQSLTKIVRDKQSFYKRLNVLLENNRQIIPNPQEVFLACIQTMTMNMLM